MKTIFMIAATIVAAIVAAPSQAQILGSCTVIVHSQGKLMPNGAGNQLSSTNSGGTRSRATVTASAGLLCTILNIDRCFGVSTPPPLLFSSGPLDASLGTVFSTQYYVNGTPHNGLQRQPLQDGSYNIEVDLSANKAIGIFSEGNYRGEVLVRCE